MSSSLTRLLVVALLSGCTPAVPCTSLPHRPQHVHVTVTQDGGTHISVQNQTWLEGAPPYVNVNKRKYSVEDGTLKFTGRRPNSGQDANGFWESDEITYSADGIRFETSTKYYLNVSMVIFEQRFPDGAVGTDTGSPNFALSGFPRFVVGGQAQGLQLGYLDYGGMFVGDTTKWIDRWTKLTFNIRDGVAGGPLALFDKTGRVLVVSSFSNFMVAVNQHEAVMGGVLSYGIMGSVKSVPKGFTLQTVVYFGEQGINQAFEGWGIALRNEHGRHDEFVKSDLAVNYLGYWTDNGAYYYYQTETDKSYDQTIFDVQAYARDVRIPYRYVQYDSWWYFMGPAGGVTKWEGQPTIFPKGMQYAYNNTGWPVVAHNRWWSSETPYSKKNGGRFNFITELLKAVPMDVDFWDWLFRESKLWGLVTYEQDWLDLQLLGVEGLLDNVHSARDWLVLMGKGAALNGLTLQYCMSFPRHAMQALEIPQVTQIRVTDDYAPGKDDWKLAVSSIIAHALRIAPYKDSFWTTSVQYGNPYGLNETHPALHALASVLSTGPVGPADAIGKTNVSLLMRCCNQDGLILKPDKPVTAIDAQILQTAFKDGSGPDGEVWSTYSVVSGLGFGIVVAAAMSPTAAYNITPSTAGFQDLISTASIAYADNPHEVSSVITFDEIHPITLQGCTDESFCLYHTAPVLRFRKMDLILFGEISKWVPMSSRRVKGIDITSNDVTVRLTGAVRETVKFWYSLGNQMFKIECILNESGTATLSVVKKTCIS